MNKNAVERWLKKGKSKTYKGVLIEESSFGKIRYKTTYLKSKTYSDTERGAARQYDMMRVRNGKTAVNGTIKKVI